MIFSPGILALLLVAILLAAYSLYAAGTGLQILVGWDPGGASAAQLIRERKTSLLSTLLGTVMFADLLCLLLFLALAERMHGFFAGAMCAAGTLRVNAYGYPALLLMLAGFVLCVLWTIVNHLDNQAPHFPLIRLKYLSLVPVALVVGAQASLLVSYFIRLDPGLITSCCGTVFSEDGQGIGADLAHLSPSLMEPLFWLTLAITGTVGTFPFRTAAMDLVYAGLSLLMLPLGFSAVISFISVRIYEMPSHHCPFCLLQSEYAYIGYPLYAGLLTGSTLGIGTGLVYWLARQASLGRAARLLSRNLKLWSLAGYALLGVIAARPLINSKLTF